MKIGMKISKITMCCYWPDKQCLKEAINQVADHADAFGHSTTENGDACCTKGKLNKAVYE
jgi:hypothetical protein